MKRITAVAALAILAALAGCATTSRIVPIGPDTYVIAIPASMGYAWEDAQNADALKRASDYCKNIGKELLPISTAERTAGATGGSGRIAADEIEFKFTSKQGGNLSRP
jgi:hypothetical protein